MFSVGDTAEMCKKIRYGVYRWIGSYSLTFIKHCVYIEYIRFSHITHVYTMVYQCVWTNNPTIILVYIWVFFTFVLWYFVWFSIITRDLYTCFFFQQNAIGSGYMLRKLFCWIYFLFKVLSCTILLPGVSAWKRGRKASMTGLQESTVYLKKESVQQVSNGKVMTKSCYRGL